MVRKILLLSLIAFGLLQAGEVTRVLVVYYSKDGHTEAMARAVGEGASQVPETRVRVLSVKQASNQDVLWADAIVVGSPVYNANVAPPVQSFINRWPFRGEPLKNKVGAAFTTGGGISAGEELVQLNILHSMLVFGMIVVGGPHWQQAFGASAVTEEPPFNREKQVDELFLEKAKQLGQRVARIAARLKAVPAPEK
jgi:NAD(P)H dehydrogenase (quinone)